MHRHPISLATLAGIAVLIAACGGSTASPAASPSAAAVAPSASPSASASGVASQAAASPGGRTDLSEIFGSVTKLDSLTGYQVSMSLEQAAGKTDVTVTKVREPTNAAHYDVSTPQGQNISIVKIEEHGWVSQDGATFERTPLLALDSVLDPFTPETLFRAFQKQSAFKALTAVGTEERNGVQATHYHIDENTPLPPTATGTIPPGASADVWVAEDGFLVSLDAQGFGADLTSMSVEVTRINDPTLQVEPPA
jgi:hypothetical protein